MTFGRLALRRVVVDACDGPFGSSLKSEHYCDSGARVIRLGNIGNGEWKDEDAAFLPLEYWATLSRHHAVAGDLLVAGLGDEGHPLGRACVMPDLGPALVKADCYRLRIDRAKADPRFVAHYLSSAAGGAEALRLAEGSTRSRLTLGKALSIPVPDVPPREQRAIADYLDAETGRIDALVSGLKNLLDLALDRHASFRDGMVDADAGVTRRRLSSLLSARITDGPHETPEFVDEGVPFLSVDNMVDDQISFEGCRRISEAAHSIYARKSLPRRGDVLVTKAASVGRVALVDTDQDFNVWSPLAILRPDPAVVLSAYLHIALLGGAVQSRMKLASTSNTQENLSMRDLSALRISVPSLRRQADVVTQVTRSTEAARLTSSALTRQIDLLIERRQALITAAVTGLLEIPGVGK